ncbi:MAG: carboxylesterase family protein [Alphaproteobacteria bacterium]|nr:carboxylesterase family protein [Alphaproteobacteria bacterium]
MRDGDLLAYKGVPFAAAPVGALRWRAPEAVVPWSGVRPATAFAPACLQNGVSMPGEVLSRTSEDCLYLNVWTPAANWAAKLPVLVWIHGGGFTNGSASMPLYSGDRLARRGIVVVTVAYRLGAFGFLAHPELSAETAQKSSGNYAFRDQIAALQWVQRNIGAFGGDPTRVTIAGQSAGAMSVNILMASPLAKGLFHRAIGQSGGFFEPVQLAPQYLLANAERDGVAFAASLGATSVEALRRLPPEAVLKANAGRISHPVIDRHVLPRTPFEVCSERRQTPVPLLVGVNAEEARSLSDVSKVTAPSFAADITKTFGPLPPPLIEAYPFKTDGEARAARIAFETDLRFGWNMWTWARLHAAAGAPVFSYRFAQHPPFPQGSPYAGWGPAHFAELWYMFDHLDQAPWPWRAEDRRLAQTMAAYWVNFVKTGNPNGASVPAWPAFAGSTGPLLVLTDKPTVGTPDRPNALAVFDSVYTQLRGAPLR